MNAAVGVNSVLVVPDRSPSCQRRAQQHCDGALRLTQRRGDVFIVKDRGWKKKWSWKNHKEELKRSENKDVEILRRKTWIILSVTFLHFLRSSKCVLLIWEFKRTCSCTLLWYPSNFSTPTLKKIVYAIFIHYPHMSPVYYSVWRPPTQCHWLMMTRNSSQLQRKTRGPYNIIRTDLKAEQPQ